MVLPRRLRRSGADPERDVPPHTNTLAYSDFKQLLKAGKVAEVVVTQGTISGTLRSEGLESVLPREKLEKLKGTGEVVHRFVTALVDDPDLVKDLEAAGVRFAGYIVSSRR